MFVGQTTRQPGELPVEATGFVGREAELARVDALLDSARLVTVTGPGGVGKTRVALRAAARARGRFSGGACLVELSTLHEPDLLTHTVASALGLPERAQGTQWDAVLAHLRDRHLLLILDTCEHLVDACAVLAEAIIAEAPHVTLLATSREPLDVMGESCCPVPPLPIPGPDATWQAGDTAADLFIQRAAAAGGFTITPGDMPDVIRLCERLDGIPLAIELAAVRLRALPLAELASRLDERLPLLTSGQRGGRHETLRDAISWSHDLCTPVEQALWARLSVFAAPVTIGAAEEVCADSEIHRDQIMATMIRLVDKSVLARVQPDAVAVAGHPTRYQMLNSVREFGAEQLAASGAETAIRNRFIGRYLTMARGFRDHFVEDDQLDRLRELDREHANVRAALMYTLDSDQSVRAADGVALATALFAYWRARGLACEGTYWLGKAVERGPAGSSAHGRALLVRGRLAAMLGNAEIAMPDASECLRLGAVIGDDRIIAHAHLLRNLALCMSGRLAEAAEAGAEAGRRLSALDARLGLIDLEIQLTYLALLTGDADDALRHVERGLHMLGSCAELWLHATLYMLAAAALFLAGRDTESAWAAIRSLQIKQEIADIVGIAFTLEVLGWLAARAGRHQRAAWLLGAADPFWIRAGGRLAATATMERLHQEAADKATGTLGDKRFAALFRQAARRPLDRVIAFAASDADDPAADAGPRLRLPGRLTPREYEIASLVADGLSNRQIAERLVISRRTVDAHVEHIFGKLRITSRVMLAVQLREQSVLAPVSVSASKGESA